MVVPSASELVPETDVAPLMIGLVTTGAAVIAKTITVFDAVEIALPDAVAFAVIACPAVKAVKPDFVQALLETVVVVPTAEPSA